MTCIVAYKRNGKVYIGGDSAGVSGIDVRVRNDQKVFQNGLMLFGFTSSFRMGNILRYKFEVPEQPEEMELMTYMNTLFIDSVIEVLRENRYAVEENGEISGGTFLVGYQGEIFIVEDDFQVGIVEDNYDSVGCGMSYALGYMFGTDLDDNDPKDIVFGALDAAEYFSGGVCAPFNILSL